MKPQLKHVNHKKYPKHPFLTKAVLIVCMCSIAQFVFAEKDSYDHFVGTYSHKATPYWPQRKITRNGKAFTLRSSGGGDWKLIFKLHEGELITTDEDGHEIKISYDPTTSEYIISEMGQPETQTLVKALPNPNEKLEKEYGVKAIDLVRKVRQSEDWVHEAKSLKIIAKHKWVKTSKGLEHQKKEIKKRFPDIDLTNKKNKVKWGLTHEQEGSLNFYFDDKRYRQFKYENDKDEALRIWDGHEFVAHKKHYTHDEEHYYFKKEIPEDNTLFMDFMWPRSKYHDFWWNAKHDINWKDHFGKSEDFILVGKENYRGVLCYVLECYPKEFRRVRRWFIGIKDGLRYGNLVYESGELSNESWTSDYKQLKPGWWFPTKQGYHIFGRDEEKKRFISVTREIIIEDVEADEKLDDDLFEMEFKDGVRVNDARFGGFITYKYKKDRSEQEWEELRQKALAKVERQLTEKRASDTRIGQAAMPFPKECKWLNTEPLTMEKLCGKTVILQFWGYWCGPCHSYMGMLKADRNDKNIVVIGIHTPEEDLKKIEDDMKKYEADGPICVDVLPDQPRRSPGSICDWYGVQRWPYWVVIGPDGKVAGHSDSPNGAFQLAATIQKAR